MKKSSKIKKIVLVGGGTGGSVTPLLAIREELKKSGDFEFLFIGTAGGIENKMAMDAGLFYKSILAGKLRRYFDWRNFLDIFKIKIAFWQSLFILLKEKPDLIITAGSFVAVPVVWAGAVLRIPIIVHQMDIRPGLANKFCAPFARVITTVFEKSVLDYGKKAVWTGNPSKFSIFNFQFSKNEIIKKYNLKNDLPIILIMGGGTGAEGINNLIKESVDELVKFCQVIHLTGKGKNPEIKLLAGKENYQAFEFLENDKLLEIMSASDLVITRAGIGALTELSALAKPAIIIPMPNSHQEDNARYFAEKRSAVVLSQKNLTADALVAEVEKLLKNKQLRDQLGHNISGLAKKKTNEEIKRIVFDILK